MFLYHCDNAADEDFTGLLRGKTLLTGDNFLGLKMQEDKSGGEPFYSFVNPSYSTLTAVLTVLMDTQTHGLANNALSPTDHSCFANKN